jgi:hypothetical protein
MYNAQQARDFLSAHRRGRSSWLQLSFPTARRLDSDSGAALAGNVINPLKTLA